MTTLTGPGSPPAPPQTIEITQPRGLRRLKLREPVRLYAYSVLTAVLVALAAVGLLTQEYADALLGVAAAVLAVVPGVEAARRTVYSPYGHTAAVWEAIRTDRAPVEPSSVDWTP